MSKDCREYELEITAAAGGELTEEVANHVAGCSACAGLKADTVTLGSKGGTLTSPQASLAFARSVVEGRHGSRRRAPLWVAPLMSASASAAALILFFGLSAPRQTVEMPPTTDEAGNTATADEAAEGSLAPTFPTLTEIELPESFEASHDVLFIGSTERGES